MPDDRAAHAATGSAAATFRELIDALRAESVALVANDLVALEQAVQRKRHLLMQLAPHARHLRDGAGGSVAQDLARQAAALNAANAQVLHTRSANVRGRVDVLRAGTASYGPQAG